MRTYEVGPTDFDAAHKTRAFRITFPSGHYLNRNSEAGMDGVEDVQFWSKPYLPLTKAPEPLDKNVKCEEVIVRHPHILDGAVHQPTLVNATSERVLRLLSAGDYREIVG